MFYLFVFELCHLCLDIYLFEISWQLLTGIFGRIPHRWESCGMEPGGWPSIIHHRCRVPWLNPKCCSFNAAVCVVAYAPWGERWMKQCGCFIAAAIGFHPPTHVPSLAAASCIWEHTGAVLIFHLHVESRGSQFTAKLTCFIIRFDSLNGMARTWGTWNLRWPIRVNRMKRLWG